MNAQTKIEAPTGLALLRAPFEPHQISKLPKPTTKDGRKGRCDECGGYHMLPAIHLDYVGHAALTDRLLDTDPEWNWEPLAVTPEGLPAFDQSGGLWIKLTVLGMTRLGYGSADGKRGGDAIKEIIGDALRNAAMRFGAALDLWHKGQLHAVGADESEHPEPKKHEAKAPSKTAVQKGVKELTHHMGTLTDMGEWYQLRNKYADLIAIVERDYPDWWNGWPGQPDGFTPLRRKIEMLEADLSAQSSDENEFGGVSETDLAA